MVVKLFVSFFVLLVILAADTFYIVGETQQAIALQFGKMVSNKIVDAGLHFKLPFIQKIRYFDKRILEINLSPVEVIASDQKRVIVDSYTKYRIIDPLTFYKTVGTETNLSRRLSTIVESSMRDQVGAVELNCLLGDCRVSVMHNIHDSVSDQSSAYGIEIIDVRIKHTDLPLANSNAVFRRMQTEREKEAKEIRAEGAEESQRIKSKADKEKRFLIAEAAKTAKIIKGNAEAEANDIFAKAYSIDIEFFEFYRYISMYKDSIDPSNTKLLMSSKDTYLSKKLNEE